MSKCAVVYLYLCNQEAPIIALKDAKWSAHRIAEYLNRINSTISRFIEGKTHSNNHKRSSRPSKT